LLLFFVSLTIQVCSSNIAGEAPNGLREISNETIF